ncbi:hypothetical protein PHPALM_31917 [Phytophthora palmivora]|uniref:Reverse transcriptase RNase H-like domain-containing protein n=1 Tax=Phytophthora palmivora TaxID=4796 RepID=A0A2P4X1D0_9STRA|nr:hypothetical protein PHPALM_31917 [Phytophthora palmivora]
MRDSLLDYARVAQPLQEAFDVAFSQASRRTKRVASGIAVDLSELERIAYDQMKALLSLSATLAFPREGSTICLLTDASNAGWFALVTQVVHWQQCKEVHEQQHELLICLSGTFTGSQRNWSIIEKEVYPIICACEKLSYLLLRPGDFRLYCDHRNLLYVFTPGIHNKEVKKHIRGKLLRWSMKLMKYRYEIEYIDGESNTWADMLSRWAGNHDPAVSLKVMQLRKRTRDVATGNHQQRKRRRRGGNKPMASSPQQMQVPSPRPQQLRPLDDTEFEWPTFTTIREIQQQHVHERPNSVTGYAEKGLWIMDKLWIPSNAHALVQRLLVVAHCGSQAHRGRDAMITCVRRYFAVRHLRARVDRFHRLA